jgi:hypothetical protein
MQTTLSLPLITLLSTNLFRAAIGTAASGCPKIPSAANSFLAAISPEGKKVDYLKVEKVRKRVSE